MFEEKRENTEPVIPGMEPGEVVSWYTPKSREGQEVVSYYVQTRPLPEKARQIEVTEKQRIKSLPDEEVEARLERLKPKIIEITELKKA